jgi:hypothetical protein
MVRILEVGDNDQDYNHAKNNAHLHGLGVPARNLPRTGANVIAFRFVLTLSGYGA